MKTILSILLFISAITVSSAQKVSKDEVPAPVTAAFAKDYPDVKGVSWKKDGANYDACYTGNAEEHAVTYTADGTLVSSEIKIKEKELPKTIGEYVSAHFPRYVIEDASKVTLVSEEVNYEIVINDKKVTFDANGSHINTEDVVKK